MQGIDDIRRENLKLLCVEYGSLKNLSSQLERDDSQVSQWLNGSMNSGTGKPRGMNSKSARYIETKTNKPAGWLDQDHSLLETALQDWRLQASGKSQEVIDQLILLAKKNALEEQDWQLIEEMAQRFMKPKA